MNKVVFFLLVLCCSVRVTYSGFEFYRKTRVDVAWYKYA